MHPPCHTLTLTLNPTPSPDPHQVARKLHGRLSSSGLKGHALLRDCLRHRELVLRPTVFAELVPARASNPTP